MPRLLFMAVLSLALAACATAPSPRLAVCDGLHRRAANPNGTVLAVTNAPESPPTPPSAAASFAPCGDRS